MKFFYKPIYEIIYLGYARVLTVFEEFFLKKNFKYKLSLEKDGFLKITSKSNPNICSQSYDFVLKESEKSFCSNKYQKKFIVSQESLDSTIRLIFNKQFCDFLTSQTGFKYSIDYFCAYQNFSIPKEHIKKQWYANHFHFDKPNSNNMLKVFIPMAEIGMNDGPLELIDFNKNKQYFIGNLGDIFIGKLSICLHKAGIPQNGKTTKLIMIQLNPSRKWHLNSNLYQRQFQREPNFTTLSNKFVKRMLLH